MTTLVRSLPVERLLDWRLVVGAERWEEAVRGEDVPQWMRHGRVPVRAAQRVTERLGCTIGEVWFR